MENEKRLIDANALKKAILAESWKNLRIVQLTLDFIDIIIDEQPTVNAGEMPCKIGDDIWWINEETETVECEPHGVCGFIIKADGIFLMDKCGCVDVIGTKYCYLTKEDAEKALKEGAENG